MYIFKIPKPISVRVLWNRGWRSPTREHLQWALQGTGLQLRFVGGERAAPVPSLCQASCLLHGLLPGRLRASGSILGAGARGALGSSQLREQWLRWALCDIVRWHGSRCMPKSWPALKEAVLWPLLFTFQVTCIPVGHGLAFSWLGNSRAKHSYKKLLTSFGLKSLLCNYS